jgi:hypothetical protein
MEMGTHVTGIMEMGTHVAGIMEMALRTTEGGRMLFTLGGD